MQENQNNHFQELKIFEDNELNILCDELTNLVKKITGEELILCGSIAKILDKKLPEDYLPKDIDFRVSNSTFNCLLRHISEVKNILMVEKKPDRIVLYIRNKINIEIWGTFPRLKHKPKKYYCNKIPYLILLSSWPSK